MTIFVPRICPRASLRASLKASLRGLADDRIQRWLNDSTSREVFKESSKEYEFRGLIMKVSQDRDSEIVDLFRNLSVLEDETKDPVYYKELETWCSIQHFNFGSKIGQIFEGKNETLNVGAWKDQESIHGSKYKYN